MILHARLTLTRSLQFHFATILSPWIRRALVAGGFGIGNPSSTVPREVAVVSPFRKGSRSLDAETTHSKMDDIEGAVQRTRSKSAEVEPIDSTDTPYFHIDLQSAVEAAESGGPIAK